MLLEIQSLDFKTRGKPIVFHAGLNTVLGSGNSVGKSTFLTVLDFVFGGDYYMRLADVRRRFELHRHTVFFTFQFDGVLYRFYRMFGEAGYVYYCGEEYAKSDPVKMPLADYQGFLSKHYGLNVLNAKFHDVVGRYIRIPSRNNLNSKNPLKASSSETKDESMTELLKLFNFFENEDDFTRVTELKAVEAEKNKMFTLYENIQRAELPEFESDFTLTEMEYFANENIVSDLRAQLTALTADEYSADELRAKAAVDEQIDALEHERHSAIHRKGYYESKLKKNDEYLGIREVSLDDDWDGLAEFFPNTDIRHIAEIQEFHARLQEVLREEFADARERFLAAIRAADADIDALNRRIATLAADSNLPKMSGRNARRASELSEEMDRLRRINVGYRKAQDSGLEYHAAQAALNDRTAPQLKSLVTKINAEMARINTLLCGSERTAPKLSVNSIRDYNFKTPNDRGTGTALRGLVAFDLCVLNLTDLPILAHDSDVLESILGEPFRRIIELYKRINERQALESPLHEGGEHPNTRPPKQIFIAVNDKGVKKKLLDGTVVLRLGAGKESLYGEEWNVKENEQTTLFDDEAEE